MLITRNKNFMGKMLREFLPKRETEIRYNCTILLSIIKRTTKYLPSELFEK